MRCPSCHAENPEKAKFCLECGGKLIQNTPPEQQRKQVTVLFADVSGFTAMAEILDAEEVIEVMNALWARLDATITAGGGQIDKHLGDGVMALWGASEVREDDTEQAVRTALEMQAALAVFHGQYGEHLAMRIGLNTGPVFLGTVGLTHEFTAMGDTVNLAARMEKIAPVGGVLISHDTYRLVRGLFDVLPQEPVLVKGRSEPVQTYVVQRAKSRAFRMGTRGIEEVETRMIGRDAELLALQNSFIEALRAEALEEEKERQARLAVVVGEPGVGKSRLLYEFESWVALRAEQVYLFKGRASPSLQGVPYGIVRDMFAYRFDILESDSAAVVAEKFRRGMAGFLLPEQADLVGHLVGFDFSSSAAVQKLSGSPDFGKVALTRLVNFIHALAEHEPLLILLEDLHWADDSSLDLVERLASAPASVGRRLLIVGLARPTLFERCSHWGEGAAARIDLRPLSRDACRTLVGEILQRAAEIPEALAEVILDESDGNPFYVEELVKMLIDEKVIERGAQPQSAWRINLERLKQVHVPATLTGILQARLDSLPRSERDFLQHAAIVGRLFWDAAVAELTGAENEQLRAALEAIRRRELIFRRERSAFAGTQEYLFKHALLRDVTYETVLLKLRRGYHARVARWIEVHAGERLGEYVGLIANHLELAGEKERALEYLTQAARSAAARYANTEAADYYTRSLALLPAEEPQARWDLLLGREQALSLLGRREAQQEDLEYLERLAVELRSPVYRARAALNRARYFELIREPLRCMAAAQEALAFAQASRDAPLDPGQEPLGPAWAMEAEAHWAWGVSLWRLERSPEGAEQAQAALGVIQMVEGLPARRLEADILRLLAHTLTDPAHLQQKRHYFEDSLRLCRATGNRRGEASTLTNLGIMAFTHSDYGRTYLEQALGVYREIGDRPGEYYPLVNLGDVCRLLEEPGQALRYYEQALHVAREVGNWLGAGATLYRMGEIIRLQGDYRQAKALLDESMDYLKRSGSSINPSVYEWLCVFYRDLGDDAQAEAHLEELKNLSLPDRRESLACFQSGWLCLQRGDPAGAGRWFQQNLADAQKFQNLAAEASACLSLGYANLQAAQVDAALSMFQRALEIRQSLKQSHGMMEAQVGLAAARAAQGGGQGREDLGDAPAALENGEAWCMVCPELAYLNCWEALRLADASLAWRILQAAYQRLEKRAETIPGEALCQSYWQNVPWNRKVRDLYLAQAGRAALDEARNEA